MSAFDPKPFLSNLSQRPGVYRMLAADGEVLYVGKARNLKNRVSTYFSGSKAHGGRTMAMVAQIASIEVTATASETEALLLEYNLIKRHRPRYNVTLRDDKSFPYLYVTTEQDYPRIAFYRGTRKLPGRFFGPYPNARATRETVLLLQKLFLLRPCSDSFFANRSRPCLQHQIKRCSGPCVGLISVENYKQDVEDAIKVLEGRGAELIDDLAQRMEEAAQQLAFERAARLRDQINGIKAIHSTQSVTRNVTEDIDAVALVSRGGGHCVSIVFVRGGRNLGSTNFFPRAGLAEESELLSGFLSQYYLGRDAPGEILISQPIEDADLLEATLSERLERTVRIRSGVRGVRARWLDMARTNAELGLNMRRATEATTAEQLQSVAEVFGLSAPPKRMECFDVSHTMGERTVASCVVFGSGGAAQERLSPLQYRRPRPGRRLRRHAPGVIATLCADQERGGAAARPAIDRRRSGAARGSDQRLEGARDRRCLHRRRREGCRPAARAGTPVPRRRRSAARSSPRFAGAASDPAHPRRGSSLRHHRSPSTPGQSTHAFRAGNGAGTRPAQAP